MAMIETNKATAHAFFAALTAGDIPDDLLSPEFSAWTTTKGFAPGAAYQGGVKIFATLFPERLTYNVLTLTAEDNRVAAEVRAEGLLVNGEVFTNNYMFMLVMDAGQIISVAEHFNPQPVAEKIMPLLQTRLNA